MKIGLVLPALPGYSETFFRNKILGLQNHGIKVVLFVNHDKNRTHYLNCKVYQAPKLNGSIFTKVFNVIWVMMRALFITPKKTYALFLLNKQDNFSLKENFKNIITNQFLLYQKLDWIHFGFGTIALGRENVAKAIGAKMAVSFRGFDIGVYPIKYPNCYNKLWTKLDKIHVISDDIKDLVYSNGFNDECTISKITPAIDVSLFSLETPEKEDNDTVQLLTVSRLHWKKGLIHTLEALSTFRKFGIAFHYTIIGSGSEEESIQHAIFQLNMMDCVTLLGLQTHAQIKEQMKLADIYIQYSVHEGFCNAVLEAQSMGLLCVVSDAEGLPENILHLETGWVVPKRSPKLLANTLHDIILLDSSKKELIKRNAINRVKEKFNSELQIQQFLKFYNYSI
ncbi:glycosyltransferase family 4 protein [uncultured Gelidibacter sp.]|uniref:glycosyltransferase family 4 protein n=1 Tax=uncultured Gelidibacter sp. TaxID=259318 RepID=UPI002629A287|nr:glycosyltransferase family 4 protein [uncultured Gelidibacter sp.]